MKKGQLILWTALLFILAGNSSAVAQADICACATYSSLQYATDYESIFPHETIKRNKIKQVIVYTTGHSSPDSTKQLFSKYIDLKFNFDNDGYVIARIQHREGGRPNEIYEFERNAQKLITKQTFTYLDSLGQKYLAIPPLITEYTYDQENRLIKEKQSDYSGKMQPDATASYTKYEYIGNGAIIMQSTKQMYFGAQNTSVTKTSYAYSENNLTCISKTMNDGKLFTTDTIIYNSRRKIVSEKTYWMNAISYENKYEYDASGKLIRYETKNALGGSECPDGGTYIDRYFYSGNGLVERITNSYRIYTCEMKFEYLK